MDHVFIFWYIHCCDDKVAMSLRKTKLEANQPTLLKNFKISVTDLFQNFNEDTNLRCQPLDGTW